MTMYLTMGAMSRRLARILDDAGVSAEIFRARRKTYLQIECSKNVLSSITEGIRWYHFGSQTEGTTSLGMESDLDTLTYNPRMPVILDMADWQHGKDCLLFRLDETSPPQHCSLQRLRSDVPERFTNRDVDYHVTDFNGDVFITHQYFDACIRESLDSLDLPYVRHGPSRSYTDDEDMVLGLFCPRPPSICQAMLRRPRPGHWPRPETLQKIETLGVFCVPVGHPSSEHNYVEFRISTNLTERLLMFDFTDEQLLVYTFLKIFRKTYFKPIVGDRFSTFHMKTAMFYTIQACPPHIWTEDKLLYCIYCCLCTIRRWFTARYCPHYTTDDTDLFVGKLNKQTLATLLEALDNMLSVGLHNLLLDIEMDSIGYRMLNDMSPDLQYRLPARHARHADLHGDLFEKFYQNFAVLVAGYVDKLHGLDYASVMAELAESFDIIRERRIHDTDCDYLVTALYLKYIASTIASLMASRCIQNNEPISSESFAWFWFSFDMNFMTAKLKLASAFFCSGEYAKCAILLESFTSEQVEQVYEVCSCARNYKAITPHLKEKVVTLPQTDIIQRYVSCCVRFLRQEEHCVPRFLRYEYARTATDEDQRARRRADFDHWMDLVVVDAVPFLYYLRFLVYRKLRKFSNQIDAFNKLLDYGTNCGRLSHYETTINMLAHTFEVTGHIRGARRCLQRSVTVKGNNNAAVLHLRRLDENNLIR